MNPRKAKIRFRQLYRLYKEETDEERILKFETELYYLDLEMKGIIECNFHPSEGCDLCRFKGRCDLK